MTASSPSAAAPASIPARSSPSWPGRRRPLWDFEDIGDWWTRADADKIAPVVAVPTTAGTGSEVGRAGVITQEATHTKKVIFHPKMMPKVVICDPELTVGMPPAITAGTGMDALAHCLEAYCAPSYHPMADGIAVEGMRLVFENLPKAVANGNDLEARAHMMSAAAMGAAAFQKGLGAIHALSHPVGALYHTHHGMTNGVFMPYVLVFNRPAIEAKIERLAGYLGIDGGFDGFLKAVLDLRKKTGVPNDLSGLKVDGSQRRHDRRDVAGRSDCRRQSRSPDQGGEPQDVRGRAEGRRRCRGCVTTLAQTDATVRRSLAAARDAVDEGIDRRVEGRIAVERLEGGDQRQRRRVGEGVERPEFRLVLVADRAQQPFGFRQGIAEDESVEGESKSGGLGIRSPAFRSAR